MKNKGRMLRGVKGKYKNKIVRVFDDVDEKGEFSFIVNCGFIDSFDLFEKPQTDLFSNFREMNPNEKILNNKIYISPWGRIAVIQDPPYFVGKEHIGIRIKWEDDLDGEIHEYGSDHFVEVEWKEEGVGMVIKNPTSNKKLMSICNKVEKQIGKHKEDKKKLVEELK